MTSEKTENNAESFLGNKFVKSFLFAFSVFLCLPNSFYSNYYFCADNQPNRLEYCLDQSWQTALNIALEKSLVFGQDFVFTFGPLGFLSTRVDIGIDGFYLFLFDVFVTANIAYILWFAWKRHYNLGAVLISLFLCYLSPLADASFKLLFIMIFHLCVSIEKDSAKFYIVPFIIAVASFFIKLNTSFLAIFIFYLFLAGSLFAHRKLDAGKIVLAILLPVALLACCKIFNVDLADYLEYSLQLVNRYNDSMNYISPSFTKYNIVIAFSAFLSVAAFIYLFFKNKRNVLFLAALLSFGAVFFVLFKQSMVRSDGLHLFAYFYFAPVLWVFGLLFLYKDRSFARILTYALSFLILIAGILPLRYDVKASEFNPLSRFVYFSGLVKDENAELKKQTAENFRLPDEIRNIIGQKSVDIIPHSVNIVYFNDLNYNPRPVFQSYAAFSEKLINLNRRKYESDTAPEFVILSNEDVDMRYGFFDDSGSKIALLENYSLIKNFEFNGNAYLLFGRNPAKKNFVLSEPSVAAINFYQNYELEDLSKSYFIKAKIDYSLFGSFSKFVYQPLNLKLVFELDDGTTREYRAVLSILESGVIINPLVESDADYEMFYRNQTAGMKKIKSFRFVPTHGDKFKFVNLLNYKEPIKIETYEYSIK